MIPLKPLGPPAQPGTYTAVAGLDELPVGARKLVWLGYERVLLYRADPQTIHAVADACPHAMQSLEDAVIADGLIHCGRHAACFDLHSGKPANGVTAKLLRIYPVRVVDGRIELAAA